MIKLVCDKDSIVDRLDKLAKDLDCVVIYSKGVFAFVPKDGSQKKFLQIATEITQNYVKGKIV
jgi:hypothetical protein